MGLISVAAFRPRAGQEAALTRVLDDRLPLLRSLGLATERGEVRMRSADGVVVSVSEWASQEAVDRAHQTPEVHELWARFDACSTFVRLRELGEAGEMFATFEAV
ncbi:MAG: antibiotic biosynthesis monooxygenase [Phycisphaerales bacterium]